MAAGAAPPERVHPEVTGMYKLFAEFPPEAGAFIMRAMEHFGRQVHGTNTDVTAQQRFADALLHALELAVAADDQAAPTSGSRAARTTVLLHVDPATLSNHPDAEGQLSHLHDGMRVTRVTSRRMACDAGLVQVTDAPDGTPMDVGRKTRTIPPALRRALDTRDGHCRFPHCEHRITDAHHITHWIDGGATDLENLVLLCRHHHTLVHEMGYSMEMSARGKVRFRTPQGIPVPDQPDAVALAGRIEGALMRRNRGRGVDPAAWAAAVPVRKLPWEVEERALEALDA